MKVTLGRAAPRRARDLPLSRQQDVFPSSLFLFLCLLFYSLSFSLNFEELHFNTFQCIYMIKRKIPIYTELDEEP